MKRTFSGMGEAGELLIREALELGGRFVKRRLLACLNIR